MPVTGIVHTKNEERDIERALRSLLPLCDELLVVDMCSTDRTIEIARSLGARILEVPNFGFVEPAWALAMTEVKTEWAIRIDADEILPARLAERLGNIVLADDADVVEAGRRNFMFGHPLVGTGWAPESDRHFFLFKPRFLQSIASAEIAVHTVLQPLEGARVLRLPSEDELSIWHFNYLDWEHFVSKMNRYTSIEAQEKALSGPPRARTLIREAAAQLAWRGVRRQAWRDGYRGLGLVGMMIAYRLLVHLKTRQLTDVGDAESIRREYDAIARAVLGEGSFAR